MPGSTRSFRINSGTSLVGSIVNSPRAHAVAERRSEAARAAGTPIALISATLAPAIFRGSGVTCVSNAVVDLNRLAERDRQPRHQRRRALTVTCWPDYRAQRELESIEGAGDASPRVSIAGHV